MGPVQCLPVTPRKTTNPARDVISSRSASGRQPEDSRGTEYRKEFTYRSFCSDISQSLIGLATCTWTN